MPTAVDTRVPDGAPWSISDDTGAMYEVRFDDVPGVPVMVYKGIYNSLCGLYRITTGLTAKQARQFVDEIVNPPQPRYEEIPEGGVVVDRTRLWELIEEYGNARVDAEVASHALGEHHEFSVSLANVNEHSARVRALLGLDPLP